MEKSKVAVDESSVVDYRTEAPSSISSEMPPAYDKPLSNTLKVARILSLTLVAVTVIVGIMVLLGIYIHHGYQCQCDTEMTSAIENQPLAAARIDRMDRDSQIPAEGDKTEDKNIPLPVKLKLDATFGNILKNSKNKKAEVNCVVETKKATQIVSQDPKLLMTPFGNITTDPKLLHLSGERMVFSCISGVKMGKSGKNKKSKGLLPRPRRSPEEECSCDCAC